ncbi:MAG TPA: M20/M25/M40 family metallo-hydrolase [Pyrinomonadaceae bacterium]|nr:M20/M25/M40 family metallo-hydrolase [Pyrinomonadaceae bacterium]
MAFRSQYALPRTASVVVTTIIIALLFTGLLLPAPRAQQARSEQQPVNFSPQLLAELKRIQQAALASDYALRQVSYLSNNIGPRLSGSAQAEAAVEYVADEMRRLGCQVTLEKVTVPHWVRGEEQASLVQWPGQAAGTTQKIVLTALGGSVATPQQGLTAQVVVVNSFEELNALGRERVTGKIVLFNVRFDDRMAKQGYGGEAYGEAVVYRGRGPSAAARLGAVASLIRSVGGAQYRLPHTGSTRYATDAPQIPAAAVAAEDADLIAGLAKQGPVSMRLRLTPQTLPDAVSYNVIADYRGSERPEEIVIVSGHLDSWDLGTGAIDDASGVAVAMQAIQLLRQLRLRPRRTIRMVAWMNEENGLAGGRAYVKDYESQLRGHVAAIEMDRGAGHPLGYAAKASAAAVEMLAPVSTILAASGAGLTRREEEAPEADITPLSATGVPAFGLWQDTRTYFDYHHTSADTFDKVVPEELAENAAVMAVLAYALADMPQPIPR